MLRSGELMPTHRDELFDLDGENPRFEVPLKRVKKRRVIQQPLSELAVEIIREALSDDEQQYVFASPFGDMPMNRKAMATALRGTKHKGKVKTPGICALLCGHSRRTICAGRRRPWLAISALMMRGSRSVSITPRARSRSRPCRASPARSTTTQSG